MLENLKQNNIVKDFECQLYQKDKSIIWVRLCAIAIKNSENQIKHIDGLIDNISERKKANDLLQKAKEEAKSTSLAKTEFLNRYIPHQGTWWNWHWFGN